MLTSGDMTRELRRQFPALEPDHVRYAIRKLRLEPAQVAGHTYLYDRTTLEGVKKFLLKKATRGRRATACR